MPPLKKNTIGIQTQTYHLEKRNEFMVMSTNPPLNDRPIGPIINPTDVEDPM